MGPLAPLEENIALLLVEGLNSEDSKKLHDALEFVRQVYQSHTLATGQGAFDFSQKIVLVLMRLKVDIDTRLAGLLFTLPALDPQGLEKIKTRFGKEVADLVASTRQLMRLHELSFGRQGVSPRKELPQHASAQLEALRKMLLAMASDMRVVLVRLSSCVTTLRYFAENKIQNETAKRQARETLELYAPLANRLGVWQIKWELEDLSFRFWEPEAYKRIALMLEEKRVERESSIQAAMARLQFELTAAHIKAEVSGRPKHIYSIWNKMRNKSLLFSELYDVRALRVIVEDIKTCYAVLGVVHDIWVPVSQEFDDYIARPKVNGYQSLHTVVMVEGARTLEVQVRTHEMHQFAEYGVAAHWRYKEENTSSFAAQKYDEKIAWLRQLLAWKTEVTSTVVGPDESRADWAEKLKSTTLDEKIYVLTPQAQVVELPQGATPIDFAYHVHTDMGHRCRGARIDGVMVPLNTILKNGQTIEIITTRSATAAGPSRDWLTADYAVSPRTRSKVRAWFNAVYRRETSAAGRILIEKTLQREGKTAINLEELAHRLSFNKLDDLLLAVGKEEFSLRHIEQALHSDEAQKIVVRPETLENAISKESRSSSVTKGAKSGVLIVGTDGLLTELAKCCKPAPPDPIIGFITRGKGVSIHRASCKNFTEMRTVASERVIAAAWGAENLETVYPVDLFILATDRPSLLHDISDAFLKEKINITNNKSQTKKGQAFMTFTAEVSSTEQILKALACIRKMSGILQARRR